MRLILTGEPIVRKINGAGGATEAPSAVFVTSDIFGQKAFGTNHPLSTGRQGAVVDLCKHLGWLGQTKLIVEAPIAPVSDVLRYHDAHYVEALRDAEAKRVVSPEARARYNIGTLECPLFPGLFDRARATVGGSMAAARCALDGRIAFFPAGGTHHGLRDRASGFCYFNDPVFAILELLDGGAKRVVYVDFDAHHGDGVEIAFGGDERVRLISLHESGRWPGTGKIEDTCEGRTLNIPLPRGIRDREYRLIVESVVLPYLRRAEADAAVIVMGADGLKGDPLSAMELSNSLLWAMVDAVTAMHPASVVLGGGGYNPWTTARLWAGYWGRLSGQRLPDLLPDDASAVLRGLDSHLIEDEDRDMAWTTRLIDPEDVRPVRDEVSRLCEILSARA